jgi:hypothetical protein
MPGAKCRAFFAFAGASISGGQCASLPSIGCAHKLAIHAHDALRRAPGAANYGLVPKYFQQANRILRQATLDLQFWILTAPVRLGEVHAEVDDVENDIRRVRRGRVRRASRACSIHRGRGGRSWGKVAGKTLLGKSCWYSFLSRSPRCPCFS